MAKKITQDEFIARAKEIHGDRYGLDKAVYVDVKTPVILICKEHGDFPITPDKLFHAHQGCPKCAGKKKTTEDFIKEAKAVHGGKYDYSKTIYTLSKNKVVITCPIHGDFTMLPYNHVVLGCDCPECSNVAKVTKEMFLRRAEEKYGDKFDYSHINYVNNETEIEIKCNVCGTTFKQTPNNHIQGLRGGCPTCRYKYVADAETIPFEVFAARSRAVHGNKYLYHSDCYTGIGNETKITCPKHGDFWQLAMSHAKGCGCNECAKENISKSLMLTTDIFKQRAIDKYGDSFDLTNTVYNGWDNDVTIKCNTCGRYFDQKPNNFLRGFGCPHCNKSAGEAMVTVFLEKHSIDFKQQYSFFNESLFCSNRKLYVDFFLPNNNVIIEFNGEQHYRPIEMFGGESAFKRQQFRDEAVRAYCIDHKIKLIEIPYTELGNIEKILTKELKINKKNR